MSTWVQSIPLPLPLRDAQLAAAVRAAAVPAAPAVSDEEDARQRQREREEAAYQRGRADAERASRETIEVQHHEFAALQDGLLASLRGAVSRVIHDSEDHLVAIAFEVAQKLVAGLPITAETVEAAIREAIAQVEKNTDILVSVHPEDMALLKKADSPLLRARANGEPVQLQPSVEVSRGGCMVQTRFGMIDARRETKAELLKKSLQT